jgi:hypothetical protein
VSNGTFPGSVETARSLFAQPSCGNIAYLSIDVQHGQDFMMDDVLCFRVLLLNLVAILQVSRQRTDFCGPQSV